MSRANQVAGTWSGPPSGPPGGELLAPTGATLQAVDWDYEPTVEVPAPPPAAGRYLAAIRWHDDGDDPIQAPAAP